MAPRGDPERRWGAVTTTSVGTPAAVSTGPLMVRSWASADVSSTCASSDWTPTVARATDSPYTSAVNDIGGLYTEGRERLSEMVRQLGPADLGRTVPACPEWTVQDVIAHLAGSCADVLAGNIAGVTTAEWADKQVRRRKDHTITQVLEEWSAVAPELEATAGSFPPPLPTLWILDLAAHEQDLRGALVQPGARETRGLVIAVDFLVREGLHRQLVGRRLGPMSVRTPIGSWTVGGQAPSFPIWTPAAGDGADASGRSRQLASSTVGGGELEAAVELSLFEAFRALTGRRSPAQIARYNWTADSEPFLPAFQFGTFTTRRTDLEE